MSIFDHMEIVIEYIILVFMAVIGVIVIFQYFLPLLVSTGLAPVGSLPYNAVNTIGGNLYQFDALFPFLFFALNILTIALAGGLNADPRGYVFGFVFLIFLGWLSIGVSNVAHQVFINAITANASASFPNSLAILAQLPLYQIAFGFIYLIVIALRSIYFKPAQQPYQMENF